MKVLVGKLLVVFLLINMYDTFVVITFIYIYIYHCRVASNYMSGYGQKLAQEGVSESSAMYFSSRGGGSENRW